MQFQTSDALTNSPSKLHGWFGHYIKYASKYFWLFLSVVVFQTVAYQFSPLYHEPFNGDLALYINIGKDWWRGIVPYVDIFDHKGPAFFEIFAGLELLGLNNYFGVFCVCIGINFVSAIFLFRLCNLWYSTLLSILTTILSLALIFNIFATEASLSAEVFILPLFVIPLYYLVRALAFNRPLSRWHAVLIGIVIGGFFWAKISLTAILLIPLLWWAVLVFRKNPEVDQKGLLRILQMLGGFIGISLIILIPLLFTKNAMSEMIGTYLFNISQNHKVGFEFARFLKGISVFNVLQSGFSLAWLVSGFSWIVLVLGLFAPNISGVVKSCFAISYITTAFLCSFYWIGATTLTFHFQIVYFIIMAAGLIQTSFEGYNWTKILASLICLSAIASFMLFTYNRITREWAVRFDKPFLESPTIIDQRRVMSANMTAAHYYCHNSRTFDISSLLVLSYYHTANQIGYYCAENYPTLPIPSTNFDYLRSVNDTNELNSLKDHVKKEIAATQSDQVLIEVDNLSKIIDHWAYQSLRVNGYNISEIFVPNFGHYDNRYAVLFTKMK